ncbi:MAG: DUF4760 domain-containing protein [Bacteroidota bacterium]
MTKYEIINLSIKALTFLVVLAGVVLTVRQLRLNTKIFRDEHDWKRRNAATEIVQQVNECPHNVRLNNEFELSNNYTPLDLDVVDSKIKLDLTLQNSIHKVLNDYEGFAVGINQGLYDEDVIKNLREYAMTRVYANFKNYIERRRQTHTPEAWNDYENLVNKWNEPKMRSKKRMRTGI